MPYTVNDFYRDFTRSHLDWLSIQERLEGISPEEILDTLLVGGFLKHISPEKRERCMKQLRQQDESA